ncbi:MAG: hypothetical protein ACRBCK_12655 [Alphaproteobacteria bacterium]
MTLTSVQKLFKEQEKKYKGFATHVVDNIKPEKTGLNWVTGFISDAEKVAKEMNLSLKKKDNWNQITAVVTDHYNLKSDPQNHKSFDAGNTIVRNDYNGARLTFD